MTGFGDEIADWSKPRSRVAQSIFGTIEIPRSGLLYTAGISADYHLRNHL